MALLIAMVLIASLAVTSPAWGAETDAIAVISPDIGEPYRGIFAQIIEGIEEKLNTSVPNFQVRSDSDIGVLKSRLQQQNTRVVIALGRQGMKAAVALRNGIRVVVGGVLTVPENEARAQPVISLSPDPALLFARIGALMPATRRVFVVYDPDINSWLIKLAKEAAAAQGLELVAYEAQDLRSAMQFYQEIFSVANNHRDVLWLPQDPTTVEESSVLPLVLQESWDKGLGVFSSNFGHVRHGVLFSLYPDNVALGRSLAVLAQDILTAGEYGKQGILPLRDVQVAINLRTAKHLGVTLSRQQQKNFDTVFPEP